MDKPTKITFAEMRDMGIRGILIYCADYRCSHSVAMSADQWPDNIRLSDIEDRFSVRPAASAALSTAKKPATGRPTCELVHNRVVRIELTFAKQDSEYLEMAQETALTRNLEIPIAICIAGIVYLALLYSVILYLG
jgi:hypothetical protein